MKYCINYFKNSSAIKEADEIIINYSEINTIAGLVEFVKQHQGQRVIADIGMMELSPRLVEGFGAISAPFTIRVNAYNDEAISALREAGIKFFLSSYASTWDLLNYHISLGVSDIYITSELGFSLDKVKKLCTEKNVAIRCFPNVCQSTAIPQWDNINTFKTFFISPTDIVDYEDYVDVCEFYGEDLTRQDTLYKIYKDEKWEDDLSIIILGLDKRVNANMIAPSFADRRISCGKKCSYTRCTYCDTILSLADSMQEEGYHFNKAGVVVE